MGLVSAFDIKNEPKASYEVVMNRMKSGQKVIEGLANYIKERAEAEERYTNELAKIHLKHLGTATIENLGMTNDLASVIKKFSEVNLESYTLQMQFVKDLQEYIEKPLRELIDTDPHWRKLKHCEFELKTLLQDSEEKEHKYQRAVDKKKKEKKIQEAEEIMKEAKEKWFLNAMQQFEIFESMDRQQLQAIKYNLAGFNGFETTLIEKKQRYAETFMVAITTFEPEDDMEAFCKEFGNNKTPVDSPQRTEASGVDLSKVNMKQSAYANTITTTDDAATESNLSTQTSPPAHLDSSISYSTPKPSTTDSFVNSSSAQPEMEKYFQDDIEHDSDKDEKPIELKINSFKAKKDEKNSLDILRNVSLSLKTGTSIRSQTRFRGLAQETSSPKTTASTTNPFDGPLHTKHSSLQHHDSFTSNPDSTSSVTNVSATTIPTPVALPPTLISLEVSEVVNVLFVEGKIEKFLISGEVDLGSSVPLSSLKFNLKNHTFLDQYVCHPAHATLDEQCILTVKDLPHSTNVPVLKYKLAVSQNDAHLWVPIMINDVWKTTVYDLESSSSEQTQNGSKSDVVIAYQPNPDCAYLQHLQSIQLIASVSSESDCDAIVSYPVGIANQNNTAILWNEDIATIKSVDGSLNGTSDNNHNNGVPSTMNKLCAEFSNSKRLIKPLPVSIQFEIQNQLVSGIDFELAQEFLDVHHHGTKIEDGQEFIHPQFGVSKILLQPVKKKIKSGSYGASPHIVESHV